MNYKTISLITPAGIPLSISSAFPNVIEFEDAVEDAEGGKNLEKRLSNIHNYAGSILLDRETENIVRFKLTSKTGNNVEYLKIYK